eukprot:scaffold54088_cov29-Prasinocladus_malaysianus.AAC.1
MNSGAKYLGTTTAALLVGTLPYIDSHFHTYGQAGHLPAASLWEPSDDKVGNFSHSKAANCSPRH